MGRPALTGTGSDDAASVHEPTHRRRFLAALFWAEIVDLPWVDRVTVEPDVLRCDRVLRRSFDVPRAEVAEVTFELAPPVVVTILPWWIVRIVFDDGTHAPTVVIPWRPRAFRVALEAVGWPVRTVPYALVVPDRERALPARGSRRLRPPEARRRGWPTAAVVATLAIVAAGVVALYLGVVRG